MLNAVRDWLGFSQPLDAFAGHSNDGGHGHTHGVVDAGLAASERGIWAIKWSFAILAVTSALQLLVVFASGSVALLADTIHNIGDATTAIPLWFAFMLARRKPSKTFTYGLGRAEDLAGILIVLIILFSALVAGYEAISRLINPQPVQALGWLTAAGLVGFAGNETVAIFRIRIGRQMNSAALIADGYHARTDGFTSLAVVLGALGVWLGYPMADPIIGLLITVAIFGIVWQSSRSVLTRMLDGVEPGTIEEIRHAAEHVPGIVQVLEAKARWLGHEMHADVVISVDDAQSLAQANSIAVSLQTELLAHVPALKVANVRFDTSGLGPDHSGHHHAPKPFKVDCVLAQGLLEIIGTPEGERMRLSITQPVAGLKAQVLILRSAGRVELLDLLPAQGNQNLYLSSVAPEEPHEFDATLKLTAGGNFLNLPFQMEEPEGHHH